MTRRHEPLAERIGERLAVLLAICLDVGKPQLDEATEQRTALLVLSLGL